MNIKSLLLGSAAALVAVSGARAADAIVIAEPEPVEYVRVCDTYGAGYFYIPGTDTCMRVGGYVRVNISAGDNVYATSRSDIDRDTYGWLTRGLLRVQTATETEYGQLRTVIELEANHFNGQNRGTNLVKGIIDLGGLSIGVHDSRFTTWVGDYGTVLSDDIMSPITSNRTNFITYTYAADNGFSAMIGVEQGNDSGDLYVGITGVTDVGGVPLFTGTTTPLTNGWLIDDYAPHVVAGVKYEQGWGGIAAVLAYDSIDEEWAGKIRVDVNVTDQLSLWAMGGYTSRDQTYLGDTGPNPDILYVQRTSPSFYGDWGGEWVFWAGGQYRFNEDRTRFNLQVAYDDLDTLSVVANVSHDIVPGLTITPELAYVSWENDFGYDPAYTGGTLTRLGVRDSLRGQDAFSGTIRLQRSF